MSTWRKSQKQKHCDAGILPKNRKKLWSKRCAKCFMKTTRRELGKIP